MKRLVCAFAVLFLSLAARAENPKVLFLTNLGSFTIELYPDKAPTTVAAFLKYVQDGFYDETIFHRVLPRFVIQGGGFTPDLKPKHASKTLPNEANNGLMNVLGAVAMARDPWDPASATTQFFINLDDNKFLNFHKPERDYYGYCVFGKVISGMDVVKKISESPLVHNNRPFESMPEMAAVVQKATLLSPVAQATP